jgi:hypothetical protein
LRIAFTTTIPARLWGIVDGSKRDSDLVRSDVQRIPVLVVRVEVGRKLPEIDLNARVPTVYLDVLFPNLVTYVGEDGQGHESELLAPLALGPRFQYHLRDADGFVGDGDELVDAVAQL